MNAVEYTKRKFKWKSEEDIVERFSSNVIIKISTKRSLFQISSSLKYQPYFISQKATQICSSTRENRYEITDELVMREIHYYIREITTIRSVI